MKANPIPKKLKADMKAQEFSESAASAGAATTTFGCTVHQRHRERDLAKSEKRLRGVGVVNNNSSLETSVAKTAAYVGFDYTDKLKKVWTGSTSAEIFAYIAQQKATRFDGLAKGDQFPT